MQELVIKNRLRAEHVQGKSVFVDRFILELYKQFGWYVECYDASCQAKDWTDTAPK
jgi:hypothetical protein